MKSYWKIRTPYEARIDHEVLFGDLPRYFSTHEEAQRRCDDLNEAHKDDKAIGGTFSVLERAIHNGVYDDEEARAVLVTG